MVSPLSAAFPAGFVTSIEYVTRSPCDGPAGLRVTAMAGGATAGFKANSPPSLLAVCAGATVPVSASPVPAAGTSRSDPTLSTTSPTAPPVLTSPLMEVRPGPTLRPVPAPAAVTAYAATISSRSAAVVQALTSTFPEPLPVTAGTNGTSGAPIGLAVLPPE